MLFFNRNLLLVLLLLAMPVLAAESSAAKPGKNGAPKDPVEITARDSFSWDQNTQSYVAEGEVHVTQTDSELFADQVTAYYEEAAADGQPVKPAKSANNGLGSNGPGGGQQISQMVAIGHVHIIKNGDDLTGDKAVYDKLKNLVTVTGDHVVIKSQGKVLTGATKVVYDMDSQQAKAVTTPGTGRLKALLQ